MDEIEVILTKDSQIVVKDENGNTIGLMHLNSEREIEVSFFGHRVVAMSSGNTTAYATFQEKE